MQYLPSFSGSMSRGYFYTGVFVFLFFSGKMAVIDASEIGDSLLQ